jgi:hypothetical protein
MIIILFFLFMKKNLNGLRYFNTTFYNTILNSIYTVLQNKNVVFFTESLNVILRITALLEKEKEKCGWLRYFTGLVPICRSGLPQPPLPPPLPPPSPLPVILPPLPPE